MILRNIATRPGRAVFAPVTRSWLRSLSTDPTPPPTTTAVAEPPVPTLEAAKDPELPEAPRGIPAYKWREMQAEQAKLNLIPKAFQIQRTIQNKTQTLGAKVEVSYFPESVIRNPPSDVTLEDLMAAQAHMGHNKALWNPANSRYIYGVRNGIHIIALEKTLSHLRRAARVVEEVAFHGGLILFMGSRPGQQDIVVRAAELAGACHLFSRWVPGTITNRDQLLTRSRFQIVGLNDEPLPGYEEHCRDRRPLTPDLVVCLNPLENYTMLYECGLSNTPTIGVIDTDADPSWVTYAIPANDDSLRTIALIGGVLGRAGERGQRRRLKAAEEGIVTWNTDREIIRARDRERTLKEIADRAAEGA